jgi:LPS export ABC transporter protein LptC
MQVRVLGLLFLCVILFSSGCGREENQVDTSVGEKAVQEILNFSSQHTKGEEQRWTLVAEVAYYYESHQTMVKNPDITIFQDGQIAMTVTGDEGEIDQNKNNLKVIGNVKCVSTDGTIYTNELHWEDKEGKIFAPGKVRIVRGDSVMFGEGMEADPELESVTLKKVNFTIYPRDEKIE